MLIYNRLLSTKKCLYEPKICPVLAGNYLSEQSYYSMIYQAETTQKYIVFNKKSS